MNNVKFDKKFGMVLREHRTKNGLTQQEVCEYLASNIKEGSYEVNTVGRYERGASVVPLTVGLALAELYRTPLAVLIESVDGISDEEMGIQWYTVPTVAETIKHYTGGCRIVTIRYKCDTIANRTRDNGESGCSRYVSRLFV